MATTMLRAGVLVFSLASISAGATTIQTPATDLVAQRQSVTQILLSVPDLPDLPDLAGPVRAFTLAERTLGGAATMPPQETPEPPTAALIGLALCMVMLFRRRRQK